MAQAAFHRRTVSVSATVLAPIRVASSPSVRPWPTQSGTGPLAGSPGIGYRAR